MESAAKNKKGSIKKRIATVGIGIIVNQSLSNAFDFLVYPLVVWKFGVVKGGLLMTFIALSICYLLILFCDWTKKDWFGLETIKEVKEYQGNGKIGKIFSWLLRKGDVVILFALSLKFDPLITTIYMRKGSHQYNGMRRRDWIIFFSSAAIANAFWVLASFGGVSLLEYLFKKI